jgi:hypothetical protein
MQPFSSFGSFALACIQAARDATLGFLHLSVRSAFIAAVLLISMHLFILWRNRAGGKGKRASQESLVVSLASAVAIVVFGYYFIRSPYLVYTAEFVYAKQQVEQSEMLPSEAENDQTHLETQLEQSQPNLHASILNSLLVPASDPDNAVVGVFAKVSNSGAAGSVSDFRISVKFDDGRELKGEIIELPADSKNILLGHDVQGRPMLLATSRYWLNEPAEVPRNEFREGFLMALVKGTTTKEMQEKHATIEFICSDVTGALSSDYQAVDEGDDASTALGLRDLHQAIPSSQNKI